MIDKRSGLAGFNHVRGARFIEENLFIFFGKEGTRPLLYKHIYGKGYDYTPKQLTQLVADETSLHFHFSQMKIGVTHKNADEVAYFASMI